MDESGPLPTDGGGDLLVGGDGNDTLDGLASTDLPPRGDVDVDTMDGGRGNDTYYVDNPDDVLIDAGGIDTVIAAFSWTLGPEFENLHFRGDEGFLGIGNELDNIITGSDFARMEGRGGNDSISGFANATMLGGSGDDTLTGFDRFLSFGEAGDDLLISGGRLGLMDGGTGNDTLRGGEEEDEFLFSAAPGAANADRLEQFVPGEDMLEFESAVFQALGAEGDFAADDPRFFAAPNAAAAHDADDRIVYDTANGRLYYDPDGAGGSAALVVATLDSAPALEASDIRVI
jgi:Ca2+-binding RTX toxin-like protein